MKRFWTRPAVALALIWANAAHAEDSGPTMHVCLRAYGRDAGQARYLVTIDWNGLGADRFGRLDIGAEDASGDTWPQLRDNRLRPRTRPTAEFIVVSDVSRYPLQFFLLGFEGESATRFDASCANGFCSLRLPVEGVTEVGTGAAIASVQEAPPCRP